MKPDLNKHRAQPLLPLAQAQRQLLNSVRTKPQYEQVKLGSANGRVLAIDISSPMSVPPWHNSGMDGYALASSSSGADKSLTISQIIAAGTAPSKLKADSAARIFTGAALPEGADAVIMQEEVLLHGQQIILPRKISPGENVRAKGQDIQQGSQILSTGTLLSARHLGVLASIGISEVSVYRPITVAVLTTGDELVAAGRKLRAGQIYNSNGIMLATLLADVGCNVVSVSHVADNLHDTRVALAEAADIAEVVITVGGVSVGDEDHVKAAVQSLGALDLWKVAIKPGKPFAFGHLDKAVFIGLPGNPVAVLVTFMLLVKPFILKSQGCHNPQPPHYLVGAGFERKAPQSRTDFLRVRLKYNEQHTPQAEAHPQQSSGALSSTVWGDGLLEVPADISVEIGDSLRFYPF